MGFSLSTQSPEETLKVGEELGKLAQGGLVVALSGNLGAGKTLLTKGIAKGLGVANHRYVSSPTFTIHKRYQGRLTLNHLDFYRLEGDADPDEVGLEEMLGFDGICVIEWPDSFMSHLGDEYLLVKISIRGESGRDFEFSWRGERASKVGEGLALIFGVA